jgi:hypothetical protein
VFAWENTLFTLFMQIARTVNIFPFSWKLLKIWLERSKFCILQLNLLNLSKMCLERSKFWILQLSLWNLKGNVTLLGYFSLGDGPEQEKKSTQGRLIVVMILLPGPTWSKYKNQLGFKWHRDKLFGQLRPRGN